MTLSLAASWTDARKPWDSFFIGAACGARTPLKDTLDSRSALLLPDVGAADKWDNPSSPSASGVNGFEKTPVFVERLLFFTLPREEDADIVLDCNAMPCPRQDPTVQGGVHPHATQPLHATRQIRRACRAGKSRVVEMHFDSKSGGRGFAYQPETLPARYSCMRDEMASISP